MLWSSLTGTTATAGPGAHDGLLELGDRFEHSLEQIRARALPSGRKTSAGSSGVAVRNSPLGGAGRRVVERRLAACRVGVS